MLATCVWACLAAWVLCVCTIHATHDAKRLYDFLLHKSSYNKMIRPVVNVSDKIVVKMGMKLTQVIDVDMKNEILSLNMWVIHQWNDVNLQWNPEEYGGVDMLYVPSQLIWVPDVVLYNNADGDYVVTEMTKATITADGGVRWTPPAIFKSYCNIDVEYFPFDQQLCDLKFGIWSYDSGKIDMQHIWHDRLHTINETAVVDPGIDLSAYYSSVEWDLISASAKKNIKIYTCCPTEPYNDVTFFITLRRKTLFYTVNLIIPCVSLTILTILEFYLPSDSSEKISLCISVLLSLSLFQLLLLEIIPPTSIKVPLVGKYILLTTIFVSVSVLLTVLVLNVNFRSDTSHEMPRWMQRLFLEFLPQYLWMERPVEEENEEEEIEYEPPCSDLSNYENPYKVGMKPLRKERSSDSLYQNVQLKSTFIGMGNLHMANECQACNEKLRKKYPAHVMKALEGVPYMSKHLKDAEDSGKVKAQWVYMALVVDRMLLWTYLGVCGFSTVFLYLNAPVLYDRRPPLN